MGLRMEKEWKSTSPRTLSIKASFILATNLGNFMYKSLMSNILAMYKMDNITDKASSPI
jgi:hypothetical protein